MDRIMKTLTLEKFLSDSNVFLSVVKTGGFAAFGLEPLNCIPVGSYVCTRDITGKHKYYKVTGVPGMTDIEFHVGNAAKDTRGCILLGESYGKLDGELAVHESETALNRMLAHFGDEDFVLVIKEIVT
jgi:hypothetical protein